MPETNDKARPMGLLFRGERPRKIHINIRGYDPERQLNAMARKRNRVNTRPLEKPAAAEVVDVKAQSSTTQQQPVTTDPGTEKTILAALTGKQVSEVVTGDAQAPTAKGPKGGQKTATPKKG